MIPSLLVPFLSFDFCCDCFLSICSALFWFCFNYFASLANVVFRNSVPSFCSQFLTLASLPLKSAVHNFGSSPWPNINSLRIPFLICSCLRFQSALYPVDSLG
ncbi:hypothetical protein ES319_A03G060400v1 [Gossypium barbadense]|uniref:Uncharacterized protein n=1 Tax=Gossypium barbadense TaxID=3634 RepID=A0A5J5WDP0_GOSBA|nr:hypothetical protein ES319_A03G060400v1 [Gossypium barbadense]